ncbi:unnamed protein product, partial [Sphacelaria rigidula]
MPQITSCGLYHQSRGRVPSRDSSPSSHSRSHQQKRGNSGSFAEGGSSGEEKRHAMVMLEQHTSAAKDGVIEVLTVEASKLGASLERAVVAKKEVEDRAQRLQGRVEEEGTRRKDLELRLQRSQAEWEGSQRTLTDIRWEVDTLRSKLLEVTESAKQRVQEETEQRLAAEDRLRQEHAVATDYLRELYDDGGKPVPEGLVSETLVQELRDFGRALQERDVRLRAGAERLDELVGQVDIERQGRAVVQDQLDIAQERLDSARLKIRQMSGQLNMEAQDNENLRAHLRGLEEESDRSRAKDQEERKARAQQRKRGGMRDAMADSKAKDDRIKALENNLMQERER